MISTCSVTDRRHADLIVVLDRGTIIERGTHDELMVLCR